jgi:bifunctional DNA-binding transcriptional regulator/antitoxin component of YhaV-PrlF toxin-antitoxin module
MTYTVESNEQGRLVIPIEVREALNVRGKAYWQLEVQDGVIILRPATIIPREDAWAYRPEHLARIEEALGQAQAGHVLELSPSQLEKLGGDG